jgi:endonuclease/exonuclease/phosphatase family metal-dependent hydrolase
MRRYWLWSAVCLIASVPLALVVLNRDMGAVRYVRVASYNAALNRPEAGQLLQELRGGGCEQARRIAEVIQRCDVDILLLCELDRDEQGLTLDVFADEYLAVGQNGAPPIDFAFRYWAPVNTGVASGMDLDGDGATDGPGDAWGFGRHPGQYAMAVLSRHPILTDEVRTFQELKWHRMPGALRPEGFWPDRVWSSLRLSSKSHWDVPVGMPAGRRLHLLCSHPTPPVFDGAEDRNGCRNHDEIRFWVDYITPGEDGWIVDDRGRPGGLAAGAQFAILGDLNCDPYDGDARREALSSLLQHPRVVDVMPASAGGTEASAAQWGANAVHKGDAALDTGDFPDAPNGPDAGPGNLRLDYVLLSDGLRPIDQGVFWPGPNQSQRKLVEASDHRLVWVDLRQDLP